MKKKRPKRSAASENQESHWIRNAIVLVVTGVLVAVGAAWLTDSFGLGEEDRPIDLPPTIAVAPLWSNFYYFPHGPEKLTRPPQNDFAYRDSWLRENGGVPAGVTTTSFVVQGRTSAATVLTGIEVDVVERRPVARGIFFGPAGAGGVSVRGFSVDLDAPDRVESGAGEDLPAVNFPYKVSATEPEAFELTAGTLECDCLWVAHLHWTGGGRSGTLTIDEQGKPFRTVGILGVAEYSVREGRVIRGRAPGESRSGKYGLP